MDFAELRPKSGTGQLYAPCDINSITAGVYFCYVRFDINSVRIGFVCRVLVCA